MQQLLLLEKRRDRRNLPSAHAISVIPPLLNTITQGGGGGGGGVHRKEKKGETIRSQLRALATHTPSLERVGQGAWV